MIPRAALALAVAAMLAVANLPATAGEEPVPSVAPEPPPVGGAAPVPGGVPAAATGSAAATGPAADAPATAAAPAAAPATVAAPSAADAPVGASGASAVEPASTASQPVSATGGDAPTPAPTPAPIAGAPDAAPAAPPRPATPARTDTVRAGPQRPSLLPLAQPLWSELDASQRQVLAPFESQWNALPSTEKRAWADLALRVPRMKPEQRQRVERRIAEWAALSPDERRLARANYRLAQQVARERQRAEWEHYQSMTPEQRSVLGTVGTTSNTAARHVRAPTGLAKEAAQPWPRYVPRLPMAVLPPATVPVGGVTPTVGPPAGAAGAAGNAR